MILWILLASLITIAIVGKLIVIWIYKYWERKKLPYLKPTFPFGNMENPISKKYHQGEWIKKMYDELKTRQLKHCGIFYLLRPAYLPIDPQYIKNIMQTDFQYFVDRGFYYNEKSEPMGANLFAIGGEKWKNLRSRLTPTFTSIKMKFMFDIVVQCSSVMENAIEGYCVRKEPTDIKDVVARYTTDIIGSCAFGLECNSFKSSEFRNCGKKIFEPLTKSRAFRSAFGLTVPKLARALGVTILHTEGLKFLQKVVNETVEYREANNVKRNDMLQILIDLKNNNSGESVTMNELSAQAFIFFAAGFETSSTTMSFCLYELAANLDIQEKVREEIGRVLNAHSGKITYEAIMDMKYTNQVVEETLRKHPPVTYLTRMCVKDYQIPDTDITIEKDTYVLISTLGLHRDPEYFPNPDKFDPERFSDENRDFIVPFTYIPFGGGPRTCIAWRFGIMEIKVGLAALLTKYVFTVNEKTILPFVIDRFSYIVATKDTIWLNAERIS